MRHLSSGLGEASAKLDVQEWEADEGASFVDALDVTDPYAEVSIFEVPLNESTSHSSTDYRSRYRKGKGRRMKEISARHQPRDGLG